MRVASRRFLAMRTWSVGLTEPSSIERFWIFMMLYTLDINTTNTVPATVFTMIGPWPRLTRSRPINTNFLNGDLNTSTIMNAISENNRVYSSWIICLSLCVFRERGTVKISKKRDVGECKLEWGSSNECGAENNWRDQTKEIKWTNESFFLASIWRLCFKSFCLFLKESFAFCSFAIMPSSESFSRFSFGWAL